MKMFHKYILSIFYDKVNLLIICKCLDDCDKEEAAILRNEVTELQNELMQLKRLFEGQLSTVDQDLVLWNEYQAGLTQIKPWLEKAEMNIAASTVKPETLQEAMQLLEAAKVCLQGY
jgi:hypothetical protein